MPSIRQIISTLAVLYFCFSCPAYAEELPLPARPHIVVKGIGEVEQVPDIVTLYLEVSATAGNFSAAKQQVDVIVAKAIQAAKKYGVKAADINASKIQAAPQYEWQNQQRTYKGERITRQLAVKSTQPDNYNDLIEGLLAAGISRLQNVELSFSDRDKLEAEAMRLALRDAHRQAQTIAAELHIKLGEIYQVAPLSAAPTMRTFAMAAAEPKAERAPLELAKQRVEQQVRVVYLLPNH